MTSPTPDVLPHADLSNWRRAPYNRDGFRRVCALVPCATIACDPVHVAPLAARPGALDGLAIERRGRPPLPLQDFLDETATDAFVVVRGDAVVHEWYAPGMTARAPHIVMSVTKAITGLVAGILADDGALDVDATVAHYVPEVGATGWRDATVRHLLDMRAGVRLDVRESARYNAATAWDPPSSEADAPADLHAWYAATRVAASQPHGGPFAYVSSNTDLLGWVLERAAGKPFATLASEHLWGPMGAADDAGITVDRAGAPRCTGGFVCGAHDLARLGRLVARDGRAGAHRVLPAAWIADLRDGGDAEAWRQGEFAPGFPGRTMRYRSGWYVVDGDAPMLFALGIHGQHLFVDRAEDIVVAKLSAQEQAFNVRAMGLTLQAVDAIRAHLRANAASQ
jgi:CubicO group peptidase (beta-lactamase class C family)